MDYNAESIKLHGKLKWKLEIKSKVEITSMDDLAIAYSPWVWEPCREIAKDKSKVYDYTMKWNTVAVISDGSAILGLGNLGGEASMPVMEWKCILFKEFSWVNAIPIILDTQDTEEIIATIKNIAPTFGGINLEDISAPRCFEIEERLKAELDIPVFHDDQHGTAIVVLAGLINSLKITGKKKEEVKVLVNWVWAAGVAIVKIFLQYGIKNIVMVDSSGTIYEGRERLNSTKQMLAKITNKDAVKGGLTEAIANTDVFVWVSAPGVLTAEMVKSMNADPIIFALANPVPEIMPEIAYEAWAAIVATGRSDFPNQVNNVLVFPGIFAWALKNGVKQITEDIKINAAISLAAYIKNPTADMILPNALDKNVANIIAESVK